MNSIQNYLPYLISSEQSHTNIDLKQLVALCEPTSVSSLGLKKKLNNQEYLRILIQPNLNMRDSNDKQKTDLRTILIDSVLFVFKLPYLLDVLIASFFFQYTTIRLIFMAYLAETLSLIVHAHTSSFFMISSGSAHEKFVIFSKVAETLIT